MPSPEIVIIGAGVIGASVAYHLAAAGCDNVRVLERHHAAGGGSTSKASGGFRAHFGSEIDVRLSLLSIEKLRRFPEEIGADPGLRSCGYLFLARDQQTLDRLDSARDAQRRAGVTDARIVDLAEIASINPAVRPDDLCGGMLCPTAGFLEPMMILEGYVDAARGLGVRFDFGVECLGIMRSGDRIAAVRTAGETIAAGGVVNAAGAWAAKLAACANVQLPVRPVKRQVAITAPFAGLPEDMPMTVFTEDGFHLRVRDGRVLLLRPAEPRGSNPFDVAIEPEWFEATVARACDAVPCLAEASLAIDDCWAGLYEMSPDSHALLGAAPAVPNFYLANGSSGHGVMHAPALGQLLAEIILDGGASSLDTHPLRPERFAEGEPNAAPVFL
jgi:sarcosine oxidase, subunit beta